VKSLVIVIGAFVTLTTVPSFACGPTTSSSSTSTTTTMQPIDETARQRWVAKRIRHLQRQGEIDNALFAVDAAHQASNQRYRQYVTDRFEYLVLKGQRKGLTPAEATEFKSLLQFLKYNGHIR
jgi:hypothetical protein